MIGVHVDRDGKGKLIDVVIPVTELDRANVIFERIMYQGDRQAPQAPQLDSRQQSVPTKDKGPKVKPKQR